MPNFILFHQIILSNFENLEKEKGKPGKAHSTLIFVFPAD